MKFNKKIAFLALLTLANLLANHQIIGSMTPQETKPEATTTSKEKKEALKILGFAENATPNMQEIKNAYHKLSLQYHSDRLMNKSIEERKQGEEQFKLIRNAYQFLLKELESGTEGPGLEERESDIIEKIWGNQDMYIFRLGVKTALRNFLDLENYAEQIYKSTNRHYPPKDKESLDIIIDGLGFTITYLMTSETHRKNVIITVAYALKNYPFSTEQQQLLRDAFSKTKVKDAWQQAVQLSKNEQTLAKLMEEEIALDTLSRNVGSIYRLCQNETECKEQLKNTIEESQDLYENAWKSNSPTLWDKIAKDLIMALWAREGHTRTKQITITPTIKEALVKELYTLMTTSKFSILFEQLQEETQKQLVPLLQEYGIAVTQKSPTIPQRKPTETPKHETKPADQPTRRSQDLSADIQHLADTLNNLAAKIR